MSHRVQMPDWHQLMLEGYPTWEIEREGSPAFVRLSHVSGKGTSADKLAKAWDVVAAEPFYKRDWTEDGLPYVNKGERYFSGWWFRTLAERDRFLEWKKGKS